MKMPKLYGKLYGSIIEKGRISEEQKKNYDLNGEVRELESKLEKNEQELTIEKKKKETEIAYLKKQRKWILGSAIVIISILIGIILLSFIEYNTIPPMPNLFGHNPIYLFQLIGATAIIDTALIAFVHFVLFKE